MEERFGNALIVVLSRGRYELLKFSGTPDVTAVRTLSLNSPAT